MSILRTSPLLRVTALECEPARVASTALVGAGDRSRADVVARGTPDELSGSARPGGGESRIDLRCSRLTSTLLRPSRAWRRRRCSGAIERIALPEDSVEKLF
jgi:hypothetical protein